MTLLIGLAARVAVAVLIPPESDVYYYLRDGARALLMGINPYNTTFTGIPQNLISAGVGHVFTYFPFTAIYFVPFVLLGDVRVGTIAADVAIASILYLYCVRGRVLLSTAYFLLPAIILFSTVYVNATLVAMVFIAWWLLLEKRGSRLGAAGSLGLALSASQFSLLLLPLSVAYYLRKRRWREPAIAVGVAALVMAPFLAAGPSLLISQTIQFQFERSAAALYTAGGPYGISLNLTMDALLHSAFGFTAPWYAKAIVELILLVVLVRVKDMVSLARNAFLFLTASAFVLPNDFYWAYLELPFMLLLFWLGSRPASGPSTNPGA